MKSKYVYLLLLSLVVVSSLTAQRRSNPRVDSLLKEKDSIELNKKLGTLVSSTNESDVRVAMSYYGAKNDMVNFEKVKAIAMERFPLGSVANTQALNAIVGEQDPVAKEKLFKEVVAKFGTAGPMYIFDVSNTYASVKSNVNMDKVMEYYNKLNDDTAQGYGYRRIILGTLLESGISDPTEQLIKKGLEELEVKAATVSIDAPIGFNQALRPKTELILYQLLYTKVLQKKGNLKEALSYARKAFKSTPNPNGEATQVYLTMLVANNELSEAYPLLEKQYRQGALSEANKSKFKQAYIQARGSAAGYDQLLETLNAEVRDSALARIGKFVADKSDAPTFTLKNMAGKQVSLASLKGKVVILDFWATWCGPCKKSFPAMQLAVNKYKKDKDVVFLFIDTWERIEDPLPSVKKYITENNYTFNVLMDLKDSESKKNKVVESYKVTGIPTKFVIDKNGKIAYRLLGFDGGDDAAVAELSAMIESAKSQVGAPIAKK